MNMAFSSVEGKRLAYMKKGGAGCFLFIHGLGASMNSFQPCMKMEAFRDYGMATMDLPGCGQSPPRDHFSYTMNDQANLVLSWMGHHGIDDVVLVGHSMGGVICTYLVEALGSRVKAFFNLEGNLGVEDCTYSRKIASSSWEEFEQNGFGEFTRSLRETLKKDPLPGLTKYYENVSQADPRAVYLSSLSLVQESCHGNLRERFLAMPTKKWYVFGEKTMNPSTKTFLDKKKIPCFIVPESGHFMMDDQPDIFYGMLLDIFAG
jgi:pimeloyl-ACP methyl ester carboxylesterase